MEVYRPLKAIRRNCLECSGGSPKYVAYCLCDGVHSSRCHLWPYRFGRRPQSVQDQKFVTPGALPGPAVPLEELPTPKITREPSRKLNPEQREEMVERLRRGREGKEDSADAKAA